MDLIRRATTHDKAGLNTAGVLHRAWLPAALMRFRLLGRARSMLLAMSRFQASAHPGGGITRQGQFPNRLLSREEVTPMSQRVSNSTETLALGRG